MQSKLVKLERIDKESLFTINIVKLNEALRLIPFNKTFDQDFNSKYITVLTQFIFF